MAWTYEKANRFATALVNVGIELGWVEGDAQDQTENQPTPITNGAAKAPGRPRKAVATPPTPPPTDPAAPSPAPPTPAAPVNPTMLPLCKLHADLYPQFKAIPAEPSGCVKCAEAAEGPKKDVPKGPKAMTLDEVKAVAQELGSSRPDGWDVCFKILAEMGAESITGSVDPDTGKPTVALDPSKYEEFARQFNAAMMPTPAAPAKSARKSL